MFIVYFIVSLIQTGPHRILVSHPSICKPWTMTNCKAKLCHLCTCIIQMHWHAHKFEEVLRTIQCRHVRWQRNDFDSICIIFAYSIWIDISDYCRMEYIILCRWRWTAALIIKQIWINWNACVLNFGVEIIIPDWCEENYYLENV